MDILVRKGGLLHAFEVKSSTAINQTILNDAALQYYIITEAGFELEDFSIIHLKPDYKDLPDDDVKALFVSQSVKEWCIEQLKFVKEHILIAKEVIQSKKCPIKNRANIAIRPTLVILKISAIRATPLTRGVCLDKLMHYCKSSSA